MIRSSLISSKITGSSIVGGILDSVEYKMPPTIDDPVILDEIREDLIKNNILKGA